MRSAMLGRRWLPLALLPGLIACASPPAPTPTVDLALKAREMMAAAATYEASLPTRTPLPTAAPRPTATPAPPTPTPAPTATPEPPLRVALTAQPEPARVPVGAPFTIRLRLTNHGHREIVGYAVAADGPWDKIAITRILPPAHAHGAVFHAAAPIPPGETRLLEVVCAGREPGVYRLTFVPYEEHEGRLAGPDGSPIVATATVTIVR